MVNRSGEGDGGGGRERRRREGRGGGGLSRRLPVRRFLIHRFLNCYVLRTG